VKKSGSSIIQVVVAFLTLTVNHLSRVCFYIFIGVVGFGCGPVVLSFSSSFSIAGLL
jgi:hypothetical protein